jgi:hypothetical protein
MLENRVLTCDGQVVEECMVERVRWIYDCTKGNGYVGRL